MGRKQYNELTFTDNFIFAKVMQHNKRLCKRLIEIIYGKKIGEIRYLDVEKTIDPAYDSKGIRLDVCVIDDEGNVYDLEMQVRNTKNIHKRERYYHGVIVSDHLKKGEDYINIPDVTVIFICLEDILEHDEPVYKIDKVAKGYDSSYEYDDGEKSIILNADCSWFPDNELGRFLGFLKTNIPTDDFTNDLLKAVEIVKLNKEWEAEYMTLEMRDNDNIQLGKELGDAQRLVKAVKLHVEKYNIPLEEACAMCAATVEEYNDALDLVESVE